ncbi:MAG TPA: quinoprotein dehydrogenase-associated putative ABC transporter substrate-binding protein [Sphingomicrobium sp.]
MRYALVALLLLAGPAEARVLKVCADPNNLPFSNAREEGFENKIIRIVAEELHADVSYVWHAQRRGNVRETLNAGECDVIPGVASSLEMLATTRPYYRSTYVSVVRDGVAGVSTFDDPRLLRLKIAVQLIGDDGSNTPPAHALSARGIVDNVRGFPIYGDYDSAAPQSPIVDAVAHGNVDVAFVWGPTAGYFARLEPVKLRLSAVPLSDGPVLPMVYDISMGVRKEDVALRRELDAALAKRSADIRAVLADYGVPLVE